MQLQALLDEVAQKSQGRLVMTVKGDVARDVTRFNTPEAAGATHISFLTNPAYAASFKTSQAGVMVMREKDATALFGDDVPAHTTLLLCDNPYAFFAYAGQVFAKVTVAAGIDPRAVVEAGAEVHPSATIEALAIVKAGAKVGARTVVKSGAVVGERATVGDDCLLYSNVVIERDCVVGNRCIFQPGSVIGADGFGFAPFQGEWVKIEQVGRVIIGDDVEIGANTTVDRGALGDTVIGKGTKLDNQIQIGHNDQIGEHCVMAACVGIAGSTSVGSHTMVGGAAMINGHINIPAKSQVGPASVITGWGEEPAAKTSFFPMMDAKQFPVLAAMLTRLPQMRKDLKALERELARLKDAQANA